MWRSDFRNIHDWETYECPPHTSDTALKYKVWGWYKLIRPRKGLKFSTNAPGFPPTLMDGKGLQHPAASLCFSASVAVTLMKMPKTPFKRLFHEPFAAHRPPASFRGVIFFRWCTPLAAGFAAAFVLNVADGGFSEKGASVSASHVYMVGSRRLEGTQRSSREQKQCDLYLT